MSISVSSCTHVWICVYTTCMPSAQGGPEVGIVFSQMS